MTENPTSPTTAGEDISHPPYLQFPKPEFFPLPSRGYDPYFGLGRSSYYDLERRGLLRLVRVRKPGNIRGKVLIPYAKVAALIEILTSKQSDQ